VDEIWLRMWMRSNCVLDEIYSRVVTAWLLLQDCSSTISKQAIFEGRQQIFNFLLGPRMIFLAILKNTLELEQWINRNREFT
jgi:hypothetical protein